MNLPTAVHCVACGTELGLEPIPEPEDLPCPACRTPFVGIPTEGNGRVHECPQCGGQWLDHRTLRTLFERRVQLSYGLDQRSLTPPLSTRVQYLPCPMCQRLMNRKNFGERSGVIVDVCKPHGVWFDPGELPRVLAFVANGGLEEAARRRAQREHEERLAAASATARMQIPEERSRLAVEHILQTVFRALQELMK